MRARDYWALTKPRVVALIVFTALVGIFLAVPGLPPLRESVLGLFGIWLAAASAAAINHLIDQRIDAVMARTANRPLPTGALNGRQVLAFAVIAESATRLEVLVTDRVIGGEAVDLGFVDMPVLNIFAEQDHLVPPDASRALQGLAGTRDYTELSFKGGHIGIYVSSRAQREVPAAIHEWLAKRAR